MPSDRNAIQETEKKLKYKNLSIEIQRMWNMKCFVISAKTGATRIVTGNNTRKALSRLQKTVVLGTSYIIRKGSATI
jgi:hypothetical protein